MRFVNNLESSLLTMCSIIIVVCFSQQNRNIGEEVAIDGVWPVDKIGHK